MLSELLETTRGLLTKLEKGTVLQDTLLQLLGKLSVRVKPSSIKKKNNTAIKVPQLSVQENQLPHHLKCSTCTYMKIRKRSFKRYAGEERRSSGG